MSDRKSINLALQGGGAHGAFTWGALTRFLEEEDLDIAAISGTSAGALNGAAVKAGLSSGPGVEGRTQAIKYLDHIWEQVGAVTDTSVSQWFSSITPDIQAISTSLLYSPAFAYVDGLSRAISPYGLGPFYQNPLRPIVDKLAFDELCSDEGPQFFVNTTRVRNGKIRVFKHHEVTTDVILASACLPTIFQAVEIHDDETGRTEAFWDGGFTGNPALFPLFAPELPDDIVIININPLERSRTPRTAVGIQNRINEISFNSSLLRELRAVSFVKRMLTTGSIKEGSMKDPNIHMVLDDGLMNELSEATKLIPVPIVLARLKEAGYAAAGSFLKLHKSDINVASTVDLRAMFD